MYPGNLHALVARDRHLSCNNPNDFVFNKIDHDTPNEKLRHNRMRRSRRTPVKIEATPSPLQRSYVDPSVRAFRLGINRGRMMDCGIFKPSDDHMDTVRVIRENQPARLFVTLEKSILNLAS